MRPIIIAALMFIANFSFTQTVTLECVTCYDHRSISCISCENTRELFSGIIVKSNLSKDTYLYHPVRISNKGKRIKLRDAYGTTQIVNIDQLKYTSVSELYNDISSCTCINEGGSPVDRYVTRVYTDSVNLEYCVEVTNSENSIITTLCTPIFQEADTCCPETLTPMVNDTLGNISFAYYDENANKFAFQIDTTSTDTNNIIHFVIGSDTFKYSNDIVLSRDMQLSISSIRGEEWGITTSFADAVNDTLYGISTFDNVVAIAADSIIASGNYSITSGKKHINHANNSFVNGGLGRYVGFSPLIGIDITHDTGNIVHSMAYNSIVSGSGNSTFSPNSLITGINNSLEFGDSQLPETFGSVYTGSNIVGGAFNKIVNVPTNNHDALNNLLSGNIVNGFNNEVSTSWSITSGVNNQVSGLSLPVFASLISNGTSNIVVGSDNEVSGAAIAVFGSNNVVDQVWRNLTFGYQNENNGWQSIVGGHENVNGSNASDGSRLTGSNAIVNGYQNINEGSNSILTGYNNANRSDFNAMIGGHGNELPIDINRSAIIGGINIRPLKNPNDTRGTYLGVSEDHAKVFMPDLVIRQGDNLTGIPQNAVDPTGYNGQIIIEGNYLFFKTNNLWNRVEAVNNNPWNHSVGKYLTFQAEALGVKSDQFDFSFGAAATPSSSVGITMPVDYRFEYVTMTATGGFPDIRVYVNNVDVGQVNGAINNINYSGSAGDVINFYTNNDNGVGSAIQIMVTVSEL